MKFDVITLFPKMFEGPLSESIIDRAIKNKVIDIQYHQLRNYSLDKHKKVDDTPYGGGNGMVLKVDVIDRAIKSVKKLNPKAKIILLTPKGKRFNQKTAIEFSKYESIILICGHYEGFDERVCDLVDEEISIGDFVLTGGEIPAMAIIDAVSRLVPKVLKENSADDESFMKNNLNGAPLLEYPQYTKPVEFEGCKVPEILLSGNHAEIRKWREKNRKTAR